MSISRLQHPNIVCIREFGIDDDKKPFLVMDFLDGLSLSQLIENTGGLSPKRTALLCSQIAQALDHAHSRSIIHRDLKPNNVIVVTDEDGSECIKIVDFGIAKLAEDTPESPSLTKTGEIFGSPFYMSPEQCKGQSLDKRSDIYSFGCLLFETLTAIPAANADSIIETLMMHVNGVRANLDETDAGKKLAAAEANKEEGAAADMQLFRGLKLIFNGCIEKTPKDRYQTMALVEKDLKLALGGNNPIGPKSSAYTWATLGLSEKLSRTKANNPAFTNANDPRDLVPALLVILVIAVCALPVYFVVLNAKVQRSADLFGGNNAQDRFKSKILNALDAKQELQSEKKIQEILKKDKVNDEAFDSYDGTLKDMVSITGFAAKNSFGKSSRGTLSSTANNLGRSPAKDYSTEELVVRDRQGFIEHVIRMARLSDQDFAVLASLKNMHKLGFWFCSGISANRLEKLRTCKSLKCLYLSEMDLPSNCFPVLAQLPIVTLQFSHVKMTDNDANSVLNSKTLKYIRFGECSFDPKTYLRLKTEGWKLKQDEDFELHWYCR